MRACGLLMFTLLGYFTRSGGVLSVYYISHAKMPVLDYTILTPQETIQAPSISLRADYLSAVPRLLFTANIYFCKFTQFLIGRMV